MSEARTFLPEPGTLDNEDVASAYSRWAPIYDLTFERVMRPGRVAIAAATAHLEGPLLDVGVGTGLELPMFAPQLEVTGIDLCGSMLARAAQRVARERLSNITGLVRMDATRMAFPDASFNCVVAPYVLTVVPEPETLLDELARVVRPGGEIILVNHISGRDDPFVILEKWLDRHVAPKLGWRPQFPWQVVSDWLDQRPDIELVDRRLLAPFGLFTFIHMRRLEQAAPQVTPVETAPEIAEPEFA